MNMQQHLIERCALGMYRVENSELLLSPPVQYHSITIERSGFPASEQRDGPPALWRPRPVGPGFEASPQVLLLPSLPPHLPPTTDHLQPTTYHLTLTTHHLPPTIHHPPPTIHHPPPTTSQPPRRRRLCNGPDLMIATMIIAAWLWCSRRRC